jgi:thioredoxin-like negative regulator of GroEL
MIVALGLAAAVAYGGGGHATTGIRWERRFEDALKKARTSHKPVIVDFWAQWCGWCHRLDKTTYVDPAVVKLSEGFVAVKVNTEGDPRETAVAIRYDVSSLPTIMVISPEGRPIARVNGFVGPGQFPRLLEGAKDMATRVIKWEVALDKNPKDAEALTGLGVHLFEQDSFAESLELLRRAAQVDAKRPIQERKQTRLLTGVILKAADKFPEAETVLKQGLGLRPDDALYDPKLLYVLGMLYANWGRKDEARVILQQVLTLHAQSSIAQKARDSLVALDSKKDRP